MHESALFRLVTLMLAAAMLAPGSASAWALRCDCGEAAGSGHVAVDSGGDDGASACCGSCGTSDPERPDSRTPADDCRDCGCPACALHLAVAAVVWAEAAGVPTQGLCGLGLVGVEEGPARGDVSDLMRPPRAINV